VDSKIAPRPPLASKERRFVAVARYSGCAVSFGQPTLLELAQKEAAALRDEINNVGVERRVAVYELRMVRHGD